MFQPPIADYKCCAVRVNPGGMGHLCKGFMRLLNHNPPLLVCDKCGRSAQAEMPWADKMATFPDPKGGGAT